MRLLRIVNTCTVDVKVPDLQTWRKEFCKKILLQSIEERYGQARAM